MADYDPRGLSKWLGPERVAVGRKVDLDLLALDRYERRELEMEALRLEIVEDANLPQPAPLGSRKLLVAGQEHIELLRDLQMIAGEAWEAGDTETRAVHIYAWHHALSCIDLWPYSREDLWRKFVVQTSDSVSWYQPFLYGEEVPYGRWVYDSWISGYEIERYVLNAWLRCEAWMNACIASERLQLYKPQRKGDMKRSRTAGVTPAYTDLWKYNEVEQAIIAGHGRLIPKKFQDGMADIPEWYRKVESTAALFHYEGWGDEDCFGRVWEQGKEVSMPGNWWRMRYLFSCNEFRVRLNEFKMIVEACGFLVYELRGLGKQGRAMEGMGMAEYRNQSSALNKVSSRIKTFQQKNAWLYSLVFAMHSDQNAYEVKWLGLS